MWKGKEIAQCTSRVPLDCFMDKQDRKEEYSIEENELGETQRTVVSNNDSGSSDCDRNQHTGYSSRIIHHRRD